MKIWSQVLSASQLPARKKREEKKHTRKKKNKEKNEKNESSELSMRNRLHAKEEQQVQVVFEESFFFGRFEIDSVPARWGEYCFWDGEFNAVCSSENETDFSSVLD